MKTFNIALRAVYLVIVALAAVLIHPALALAALASTAQFTLCTSSDIANSSTTANYVTLSTNAKEEAWVKKIKLMAQRDSVFADNMIGTDGSDKPIIDYTESGRIDGTTIHISVAAQLGAPGVQGEGARLGQEEKVKPYDFSLITGCVWFGVSQTSIAQEQTIIGSQVDTKNSELLANRLRKKITDDIEMTYVGAGAGTTLAGTNMQFPNGKTFHTLKSADTISLSVITRAATKLSGLGGMPIKMSKGRAGGPIEKFLFFGTHENLNPLNTDSAYLTAMQNAQVRDDTNPLFNGDYSLVAGHAIYRDYVRRHDAYGSVGCALQPDAFLGIATPGTTAFGNGTTTGTLNGGGNSTAATVTPLRNYFEFWQLYTYTKANGDTVTTGATTAYGCIIDATTGKTVPFSYTANTGNTLTGALRLGPSTTAGEATTVGGGTGSGGMSYSTAAYDSSSNPYTTNTGNGNPGPLLATATAVAAGSYMFQTNSLGVPIGYTLALARGGMCFGWGKGPAGNIDGERRVDTWENGRDIVWGLRVRFGCRVFLRTDAVAPGFVLVCAARQIDGALGVS